jgi:hypothetical protein
LSCSQFNKKKRKFHWYFNEFDCFCGLFVLFCFVLFDPKCIEKKLEKNVCGCLCVYT